MTATDNATGHRGVTVPTVRAAGNRGRAASGLVLGALGVLAFSFSFPATKLAVAGFDPWLIAFGRAAVASLLAGAVLRHTQAPRPSRPQVRRLIVVAAGVVIGFPLFSSLALVTTGAAHGAVVVAVLPAATALVAVVRGGERPRAGFWVAAAAGLAVVVLYTVSQSSGRLSSGDGLLVLAVAVCAVGYAEGGALSRELGGARTICWALVISAPLTGAVTVVAVLVAPPVHASLRACAGFGYLAVVSMFLGFFAWYAGLARGGVARIGQIQLLQPLLTVGWSVLTLGEHVNTSTLLTTVVVLVCVIAALRTREPAMSGAEATPDVDTQTSSPDSWTTAGPAHVARPDR